MLKPFEDLPETLKNDECKKYYDILVKRKISLFIKRAFDIVVAFLILVILSPVFLIISVMIKFDSKGPVIFKQSRVTQYNRDFKIYKFRTMVNNADKIGSQVTTKGDARITRVGKLIRKCRLDEIPQLINVLKGDMTFVGTRPEVRKYVDAYTDEMMATLLLKAGITSEASIFYKDEDTLLSNAENIDETYIKDVLPGKMEYNLNYIENFGFWYDILLMFKTFFAVIGIEIKDKSKTGRGIDA